MADSTGPTEFTVQAYQDQRQPFSVESAARRCPACGGFSTRVRYRAGRYIRGGSAGQWLHVRSLEDTLDPHLLVTCLTCDFDWEMEVARARSTD